MKNKSIKMGITNVYMWLISKVADCYQPSIKMGNHICACTTTCMHVLLISNVTDEEANERILQAILF